MADLQTLLNTDYLSEEERIRDVQLRLNSLLSFSSIGLLIEVYE